MTSDQDGENVIAESEASYVCGSVCFWSIEDLYYVLNFS